jgi:hypothetical protein
MMARFIDASAYPGDCEKTWRPTFCQVAGSPAPNREMVRCYYGLRNSRQQRHDLCFLDSPDRWMLSMGWPQDRCPAFIWTLQILTIVCQGTKWGSGTDAYLEAPGRPESRVTNSSDGSCLWPRFASVRDGQAPARWGNAEGPGSPVPERQDGLLGTINYGTTPVLPIRLGEKPLSPPPTGFTAHNPPFLGVGTRTGS